MSFQIDLSLLDWIEDGEPHNADVYNRPTEQLGIQVNNKLNDIEGSLGLGIVSSEENAIVYAIALG